MKSIFRVTTMIISVLLFVSFIGCGGDDDNDVKDDKNVEDVLDFVHNFWQISSINGENLEMVFTPSTGEQNEQESETTFLLKGNTWYFDDNGMFNGTLDFVLGEKYPDPVSSMTQEISVISKGEYTVEGTTMTINKQE